MSDPNQLTTNMRAHLERYRDVAAHRALRVCHPLDAHDERELATAIAVALMDAYHDGAADAFKEMVEYMNGIGGTSPTVQ